jgi:hypothetical protein
MGTQHRGAHLAVTYYSATGLVHALAEAIAARLAASSGEQSPSAAAM